MQKFIKNCVGHLLVERDITTKFLYFFILDMHVQNKKPGISSLLTIVREKYSHGNSRVRKIF